MTTMSSREFNQDAGKAKRLAMQGPVFITDRGRLAPCAPYYRRISKNHGNAPQYGGHVRMPRERGD